MALVRPYRKADELPAVIPVFPLAGVLLLPRSELPLNIFEPRYLQMIDDALASCRLVGMVQPRIGPDGPDQSEPPALSEIGCIGRISAFQETGDGRYLITLSGVARFRILSEVDAGTPYRQCRIDASGFAADFQPNHGEDAVDRRRLIDTFRDYLDAHDLETDWGSVERASNETLVNALSIMSPYGPREKQALLEADDLGMRAEVLIAVTEMALARSGGDESGPALQ